MPSDNGNAKNAAIAAARRARAEGSAAVRTAMNVSRQQLGKQPAQEPEGHAWVTAIVVVAVVVGMLILMLKFSN